MKQIKVQSAMVLAALLIFALYLRSGYLTYALPYIVNTDEMTNFNVLQRMIENRGRQSGFLSVSIIAVLRKFSRAITGR